MKNKLLLIFIAFLLLVSTVFVIRFIFGGDEDTWICVDGKWVKHGNPARPAPTQPCVK